MNANKVAPEPSSPPPPPPASPPPSAPDAGRSQGRDGDDDANDDGNDDGTRFPASSGRQTLQPLQRPPRTIDRAKINVRRGSQHLKQLFNPKPETELDLDTFYQKRTRRRTQLQHEIASTLISGGMATGGDGILEELASSPSMMRSMRITLSPGEEYENYQKVNAASTKAALSLFASTASQLDDDDENPRGSGAAALRRMSKLEDVTEETVEDLQRRATLFGTSVPAEIGGPTPTSVAGIIASAAIGTAEAKAAAASPKFTPKRLHRMKSVSGKANVVHHVSRMVNPLGRFRLAWDVVSISFIFYNAFAIPFDVSFNVVSNDTYFDTLVDIFFVVDIIMTFNTAVDVDGTVRYDRRLAATIYLNSWFAVDVVAALPYAYMVPHSSAARSGTESADSLVKSLKLLRLVRLLRLFRISRILRRIQNAIFIRSTLSSLIKYCMLVMFVSHWFSCAFHGIGAAHESGANWISAQGLEEPHGDKWDRYVCALYFAVQTLATIGFGDVAGANADERLFGIFAMIMGGGIFAYGITNIVELVSSLTIQETRFRQRMDEVNEYMSARELPMKLRIEIREFYHNTRLSRESKLNAEQQILGDLSSKLRSKIALSINDQFLRKFPFFTGSEPNFLMELALNMRMIHFAPLEDVIIEGEIGHEMFFIFRGAVEVQRDGVQIGILGENQYFGEMAILSPDNRRTASVRTLCFCELRMLSRNRFLDALSLYPAMQTKMAQVARVRATTTGNPQAVPLKNLKENHDGVREAKPTSTLAKTTPAATGSSDTPKTIPRSPSPPADQEVHSSKPESEPPRRSILLPRPLESMPTYSRLSLDTPATSSLTRIQQTERRTSDPFIPFRTTASTRLSGSTRRGSNPNANGISPSMSLMITDITLMLEEVMRRQDLLVTRVVRLKNDLDQLKFGESTSSLFSNSS